MQSSLQSIIESMEYFNSCCPDRFLMHFFVDATSLIQTSDYETAWDGWVQTVCISCF